jgi:hypothetical protein
MSLVLTGVATGDLLRQRHRDLAQIRRAGKVDGARYVDALHLANNSKLQHRADEWIVGIALERRRVLRPASVVPHREPVHELDPRPDWKPGEIDDDVVALGYALLIQGRKGDGVDNQVAVIGDELERYGISVRVGERQLYKPGHAGIEDAETVLPRQHFHEGGIGEIDEWHIAQEAIGREDIEKVLSVLEGRQKSTACRTGCPPSRNPRTAPIMATRNLRTNDLPTSYATISENPTRAAMVSRQRSRSGPRIVRE